MDSTIWKYTLRPEGWQTVRLPGQCQVLSAAEQDGALCMWARVDPAMPLYDYTVAVCMTGGDAPVDADHRYWSFIDTVLMRNGIVAHVFVLTEFETDDPQ